MNIFSDLQNQSNWEDKYRKIIQIGQGHSKLSTEDKVDDLLVKGCVSRVWLKASLDEAKNIQFESSSDALITKGLAALVCLFYSGKSPDTILSEEPSFIDDLGLSHHLTPNRANGLFAMVKQIKYYAQAFKALI